MIRSIAAGLSAGLVAGLGGCAGDVVGRGLPSFAVELPGHAAIVTWGGALDDQAASLAASVFAALPIERIGFTEAARAPVGVRAWLGDPAEVGWTSLAANQHFVHAAAEFAPTGVHLFVDLQQTLDAARAALPALGVGDAQFAGLSSFVEQRVWRALRLDALEWLFVKADDTAGRTIDATIATGEARRGLLAVLAERALPAPAADVPASAELVARATFVPRVIAAGIRELLADAGEGPMAALQQLVQGTKLPAAIDGLESLDGSVVVAFGSGWGWAACGVRDATAVEAALDAFAVARGGHWVAFGNVHLTLDDAVLRCAFGVVPPERRRLDPTAACLHVASTTLPFELTATRVGGLLRVRGRLP